MLGAASAALGRDATDVSSSSSTGKAVVEVSLPGNSRSLPSAVDPRRSYPVCAVLPRETVDRMFVTTDHGQVVGLWGPFGSMYRNGRKTVHCRPCIAIHICDNTVGDPVGIFAGLFHHQCSYDVKRLVGYTTLRMGLRGRQTWVRRQLGGDRGGRRSRRKKATNIPVEISTRFLEHFSSSSIRPQKAFEELISMDGTRGRFRGHQYCVGSQ